MNDIEQKSKEYTRGLGKYLALVHECISFDSVDNLRLETQFESIKDWSLVSTIHEIRDWFLEQQKNCRMKVEDIPLDECRGWHRDEKHGWLTHESGEFFYVQGIRVTQTSSREVGEAGWDQPILTQVGYDGGLLGILRKRINNVPHYLVEAKAEPGNYDLVQISPTLQATFSNLKRAHSGRKPRFSDYFENPADNEGTVLYKQWMSEDGGRLYKKRNMGMLVEIPEQAELETTDGFTWMSLWQIKTLLKENSWINPHIRGIISSL